jgi:hypothetical protein
MPYEQELVERVRRTLSVYQERTERKMFGGLAFNVAGQHVLRGARRRVDPPIEGGARAAGPDTSSCTQIRSGRAPRAEHGDGRRGRMPDRRGGRGLGAPSG